MKSSILERVKEMTRQAREREAEKLLAITVVKARISDAAGEGFNRVVIAPEKPVDLAQTTTAKETVETLYREGFGIEWEVRQHLDGRPWQALIIIW